MNNQDDNLVLSWDRTEILETELEHRKNQDRDIDEEKTEQELREAILENWTLWEHQWTWFKEQFQRELDEITSQYKHDNLFYVSGQKIGWRNHSGERIFNAEKAEDLINKITPERECTIEVRKYTDKKLDVTVKSHDSPTGETYVIHPVYASTAKTYQRKGEKAALENVGAA